MKKILLLTLAFVSGFTFVRAQTFSDNFESYTVGNGLVSQNSRWELWPATSAQDVNITNTDAYSGTKSIYFSSSSKSGGPTDIILPFGGERNYGHFVYSQRMKIPSGKNAYFNFQKYKTAGSSGGWALDAYLYSSGRIEIKNGGTTVCKGNYPQGSWFEIKFHINLISNKWELLINNVSIGSWSNSSNQLASIDLYPVNDTSSFWVDDVYFKYYPPAPYDASAVSIDSPASFCPGVTRNIYATVRNFGTKVLDSITVNWMLNGKTQTPVKYKTAIDTFNGSKPYTAKIKLGSHTFKSTADTIKVWTSLPNGKNDTIPFFDTVYVIKKPVPPPTAVVGDDKFICLGSSVKIGASSATTGLKYSWTSNPAGFTSVGFNAIVSPTVTTTYKLVVTATATGCSDEDSVTVTVRSVPKIIIDSFKTICQGDSVQIGVTRDSTLKYSWTSDPAGFSSSLSDPYVKPGANTVYKLTVTDSNGCSTTYPVDVKVNPLPIGLAGLDKVMCEGSAVFIGRSALSGHTYSWKSDPAGFTSTDPNPMVKPGKTTTYILTATNSYGCSTVDEVVVEVIPLPIADAGSDTGICIGKSAQIGTPAQTGLSYAWSSVPSGFTSSAANPTVSPKVNTTYKVTVRNSSGCIKEDSVKVTVNALSVINIGAPQSVCPGDSATIGPDAEQDKTYSWTSDPAGFTSTDAKITVSPSVTTTYKLIVTNASGCKSDATIKVNVLTNPTANAGTSRTICKGSSTQIGAAAEAGMTYSWTSDPAGFTSTDANPTVTPTEKTTYKLTVKNANGCTGTADVTLNVYSPTSGFTVSVQIPKATFTATNTNLKTYEWEFGDGGTGTGATVTHTYTKAGTYNIKLTVTDNDGCTGVKDSAVKIGVNSIGNVQSPVTNINLYPNPFSTSTTLFYKLPKRAEVNIVLMDVTGKQISELVNSILPEGEHMYNIKSADHNLKPGIYFVQMRVDGSGITRKIMKVE